MRKFSLLLLLLSPLFASAQGVMVSPQAALKTVNGYTTPIPRATITVCAANTGGVPCSPALVGAIYSNTALTLPLSNPFTADASGNYQFAIAPGNYTVTVTAAGFAGYSYQITTAAGTALPVYLNSGTPVSQTNECASLTQDSSGHAITAVAALRTINASNVGHDVACVVTADALAPTNIGSIVFPFITAIGNAGPSQGGPGLLELVNTNPVKIFLENTSGTVRSNGISFRSCVGGCGTDFRMIEDVAGAGNEDMTWIGPSNSTLYVTFNCPSGCGTLFTGSTSAKQFLLDDGTHDAKTNPEFALVNGHLGHGTTGSNATDTWGTATCNTSTATVTFATAFQNTSYSVLLTDQTTAGGAKVSTKNVGSMVITCTGASDSVDYLVLGNPY